MDGHMYSQGEEERILLDFVEKRPGVKRVLDIGAHDGTTFSNSRALIERDWAATLIEPSPLAFQRLLDLYGENKAVRLIHAAVAPEAGLVEFHDCAGDLYGTTLERKKAKAVEYVSYWVPAVTIPQLINRFEGAHSVVSIDTEGNSFEILKTVPVGPWDVSAIVVEHDDRIVEIAGWARKEFDVGYVDAQNIVLLRKP